MKEGENNGPYVLVGQHLNSTNRHPGQVGHAFRVHHEAPAVDKRGRVAVLAFWQFLVAGLELSAVQLEEGVGVDDRQLVDSLQPDHSCT